MGAFGIQSRDWGWVRLIESHSGFDPVDNETPRMWNPD
jgi:hypothetical protein